MKISDSNLDELKHTTNTPNAPQTRRKHAMSHYEYKEKREGEMTKFKGRPKTKLRIVYKIVTKDYTSLNDYYCTLEYKIEQKTKTPMGGDPLIAFVDLASAELFKGWNADDSLRILKCVGKVRLCDSDFSFLRGAAINYAPTGSILCDWVFPIEEIK